MRFTKTLSRAHLSALTLRETESPNRAQTLLLGALHFIGLAALARVLNLTVGEILFCALIILAPFVVWRANLLTLAPWLFVYPFIAFRFLLTRITNAPLPTYVDDTIVNPLSALIFLPALAASAYVFQFLITAHQKWKARGLTIFIAALACTALVWAGAEFIGHRTRGVTGTDPYAYVQMGIDFATRGTFLHRFDLFPYALNLNVAWYPIVHVGYNLPLDAAGDAPSVWSPFGSLLYAFAYRLAGEGGLYLVNPLLTIFAAGGTAWLAYQVTRRRGRPFRAAAALLAGALILSSQQQSVWARVPMADAQAELFTTLAFVCALRNGGAEASSNGASRARQFASGSPFLAGIFLGLAYDVRHTQVLIAPALVMLVWWSDRARREKSIRLVWLGVGALLVALPDLWYHQTVFGSFLHPESNELALFSLGAIGSSIATLWDLAARGYEWGWLIPLLAIGARQFAKQDKRVFFALSVWTIVLVAFHLPYEALRLRDLIPEFPPLAFLTAYGFVSLISLGARVESTWQKFSIAFLILLAFDLFALRAWYTVGRPLRAPLGIFGYLTSEQRAAFDEIARITPPDSIIGAGFNTGALDLYSQRATIRPADWTPGERGKFFCAAQANGRAIYLLDDNSAIDQLAASGELKLTRRAQFDVPIFDASEVGNTRLNEPGTLWQVDPVCSQ